MKRSGHVFKHVGACIVCCSATLSKRDGWEQVAGLSASQNLGVQQGTAGVEIGEGSVEVGTAKTTEAGQAARRTRCKAYRFYGTPTGRPDRAGGKESRLAHSWASRQAALQIESTSVVRHEPGAKALDHLRLRGLLPHGIPRNCADRHGATQRRQPRLERLCHGGKQRAQAAGGLLCSSKAGQQQAGAVSKLEGAACQQRELLAGEARSGSSEAGGQVAAGGLPGGNRPPLLGSVQAAGSD